MKTEDINNLLKSKGFNYSMIAEAIEVSPAHVRNVAERIAISQRVAKAIAKAVDLSLKDVFPEYIDKLHQKQLRAKRIEKLTKQCSQTA